MQFFAPTSSSYFPSFLRLYLHEIRKFLNLDNELFFSRFQDRLEPENNAYLLYVKTVLDNPVAEVQKNWVPVKLSRKSRNDEENERDKQNMKEKEQAAIREKAAELRSQVILAFVRVVVFDKNGISILDSLIKEKDPSLYKQIHLYTDNERKDIVEVFLSKFYKVEDKFLLDRVAASFEPEYVLTYLSNKFKSTNSEWNQFIEKVNCRFEKQQKNTRDTRRIAQYFLRNLPTFHFSTKDDWFFDFIGACANDPYNSALLLFLLPNYEEVLSERETKLLAAKIKTVDNKQRTLIEEIENSEPHQIRPPSDYHTHREVEYYVEPRQLLLRPYQDELVTKATGIQRENVVVCAPTGSGKTEVAVFITKNHLEWRTAQNKPGRVVMVVPKVPLVDQQKKRFNQYVRGTYYVEGFHGLERPRGVESQHAFLMSDIIIMTPQVLLNMLTTVRKSERIYVCDISLLIFDEVHHCKGKHPYKLIMDKIKDYTREKPQIIGLTASLIQSGSTNKELARDSIYELMSNVSATGLSTVRVHIAELEKYVPRPTEEYKRIDYIPNRFGEVVSAIVRGIKGYLVPILEKLTKKNKLGFSKLQPAEAKLASEKNIPVFLSSVYRLVECVTKVANIDEKQDILTACKYLLVLANALAMCDLLPYDATYSFLYEELTNLAQQYKSNTSKNFYKIFDEHREGLNEAVHEQQRSGRDCEILETLKQILQERFNADPDSRCIIFVMERSTAVILSNYLNMIKLLGTAYDFGYVISARSTAISTRYGQTLSEQTSVLKNFNSGEIKCIVSTSVLDEGLDVKACNIIIKYNTTSSAVSRIQKSGRARAFNSKSYLLCLSNSVANSEFDAIIAEKAMKGALQEIHESGPRALQRKIEELMIRDKKLREKEADLIERKKKDLAKTDYDICCPNEHFICNKLAIHEISEHRVVIDKDIWERLWIKMSERKASHVAMDHQNMRVGKAECMGVNGVPCGEEMGTVLLYSGVYLPTLRINKILLREVQREKLYSNENKKAKSWEEIKNNYFFIPTASERDLALMLSSLQTSEKQGDVQIALDLMCDQLRKNLLRKQELQEREKNAMRERATRTKLDWYSVDQARGDSSSSEDESRYNTTCSESD